MIPIFMLDTLARLYIEEFYTIQFVVMESLPGSVASLVDGARPARPRKVSCRAEHGRAASEMSAEARLKELGIDVPEPVSPVASYVPAVKSGNQLWISGQVTKKGDKLLHNGKLGAGVTVEQGQEAARQCALNALAAARKALGSLDRVARVIKVVGYVASAPGFTDQPKVVNGASDLLVQIFGENGRHARSAVGVAELPLGVCVEVEMVLEIGT
jgi:enamine deaminase RidA (YjgF/YER057c/UK114 family)